MNVPMEDDVRIDYEHLAQERLSRIKQLEAAAWHKHNECEDLRLQIKKLEDEITRLKQRESTPKFYPKNGYGQFEEK